MKKRKARKWEKKRKPPFADDGWNTVDRDANGNLKNDPSAFPSGMKAMGDYIHARGLKYGLYLDAG